MKDEAHYYRAQPEASQAHMHVSARTLQYEMEKMVQEKKCCIRDSKKADAGCAMSKDTRRTWKEQEVKLRKEWMEINLGAKVLLFCGLDKGAANRMFAI